MKNQVRIPYIDRLKGFCIIAVVFGHFIIWPLGIEDDFLSSFVASFHMPIFMFLSGFVISSPLTLDKCIGKIPHFLFPMFIIGGLYVVFRGYTLYDFFFDSTKIGYWYFWVLSIFYLLLSLLPFYIEKTHVRTLQELIYGLLVGGLFLIIKLFSPNYISDFISADQCFGLWFCFFFGFMSRRYSILDKILKKEGSLFIILCCYICLLLFYATGIKRLYMLVSITSILPFIHFFRKRNNKKSIIESELEKIGKNSLYVYIFHYFLLRIIFLDSLGSWFKSTHNLLLEALVSLFFAIFISYICITIGRITEYFNTLSKILYGNIKEIDISLPNKM